MSFVQPQGSGARELVAHEVLVVDADPMVRAGVVRLLAPAGLHVTAIGDPARAVELVTTKFFGVVIIDLDSPTPNAGVEVVREVHTRSPTSRIIVLSPRKSFDAAVTAFRAGAHDVVMKAPDQVGYLEERVLDAAGTVARAGATHEVLADVREAMDGFLERLMDAERRALDLEDKLLGRDPLGGEADGEVCVLVADSDPRLHQALSAPPSGKPHPGFRFAFAQSGGEALDHVTRERFQLALVGPNPADLPQSMLVKALKTQAPELIVIAYAFGGPLEVVETTRTISIADELTDPEQVREKLDELAAAHRAKGRERRTLRALRERHYDLLRRFAELKRKLG